MTIRLNVEYLVTLNYFPSLRKIYNFIDICLWAIQDRTQATSFECQLVV